MSLWFCCGWFYWRFQFFPRLWIYDSVVGFSLALEDCIWIIIYECVVFLWQLLVFTTINDLLPLESIASNFEYDSHPKITRFSKVYFRMKGKEGKGIWLTTWCTHPAARPLCGKGHLIRMEGLKNKRVEKGHLIRMEGSKFPVLFMFLLLFPDWVSLQFLIS